jgi:cell division protein FtsZ
MIESQEYSSPLPKPPVLKVIGLGGGGCNAINRMIELGLNGVEFIAANTDFQALRTSLADQKIQLGPQVTRGLGAGGRPEVGESAASESEEELADALRGADMVFLTAGMGGGTGTGSIPIAARVARAVGAVTISIVTTPFSFEMGHRQRNASLGLARLAQHSDTLISIPNDRLLDSARRDLPLDLAFRLADDVLRQAVQGITELVTEPGLINVDFAHIHHIMKLGGGALMSIGFGKGPAKAIQALNQALHHPLLEEVSIKNAAGIIANFTGGEDLTLYEVNEVLTLLHEQTGPDTEIVFGLINDDRMESRTQVILVITGLGAPTLEEVMPGVAKKREVEPSAAAEPIRPAIQQESQPVNLEPLPLSFSHSIGNDLDVPAFLRRRIHQNQ